MKKILMINWDNYPNFSSGGVYTWEKTFIEGMPENEFIVLNQLSNPNISAIYSLPNNVSRVIEVPLFGTNRFEEFSRRDGPLVTKIIRTTDSTVKKNFLPMFQEFLGNILADRQHPELIKDSIFKIHKFLISHDAKKCLEHPGAWEVFLKLVRQDPLYSQMGLREAVGAFQFFQRGLQIISMEIPKVDIVHSSLVWFPSMAALCAKKEHGSKIVVTEHGVAFREQLLYYNTQYQDDATKILWKTLARNIIATIYAEADAIVPVCNANALWEKMLGANESRIRVIYNGINLNKFRPIKPDSPNERPTISSVARIDGFKDIPTLIRSVHYVREKIPNTQCLLYGGSIDLEYSIKCVNLVKTLRLEGNFKFMGSTKEPERAYNIGDVVALTSIAEGFPFSVIEAMACGKAIVAADVGGVAEALEGCGLLVSSRNPQEMANAIVDLLRNEKRRSELGELALKRARERFSLEKSIDQYRDLYDELLGVPKKSLRGPEIKVPQ